MFVLNFNNLLSIKRKIYLIENMNILNTTSNHKINESCPFFTEIFPSLRGRERSSYIPFLLNPETRSDVILVVRLRFHETIPQAG